MKKQLINPAGYAPVSVTGITVDGSTMNVEKSDGTTESQQLPSGGGSGSDTDIVEVKDTVTTVNNADQHVITATEGNGTENEVGRFVVGLQQIVNSRTSIGYDHNPFVTLVTVNQSGDEGQMRLSSEFGNIVSKFTSPLTLPESFSGILVYCNFQISNSEAYIPFSISREMLRKLGTEIQFIQSHTYTPTNYVFSAAGVAGSPIADADLSLWTHANPYICTIVINSANVYVQVQSNEGANLDIAFI